MSSNKQYYSSSFATASYSSSSSADPEAKTARYTQSSVTDPQGTTTRRTVEESGKQPRQETSYTPAGGRLEGGGGGGSGGGAGAQGRIEDVTDEQAARDREYEERMEDEYAKREGGA
jgi:hypothetical protein